MNVFLARQPVFNKNEEIVGYELLYRSNEENVFKGALDGDEASSKVIFAAFQDFGLHNITSGLPAFINFPAKLIEEEVATLFSKDYLVVEILETVAPTPFIVEKCRALREAGYHLALDDFVYSRRMEPLLDLASIVKVDFRANTLFDIKKIRARTLLKDCVLLAEKIETWEDFRRAKAHGFTLFQGYFFEKPEVLTTKSLTPLELNYFQLVAAINEDEVDFGEVARLISMDVALTYNLLKLVNSAAFGQRHRLSSLKQALVVLGQHEIKKWVTLIALQGLSSRKMDGAVGLSLVRARFAQLLAQKTALKSEENSLYLTGLFSMLDVLLQRPLELILEEIHAPEETKECLLHGTGPYVEACNAIMAYEKGEWDKVEQSARRLNLDSSAISESYLQALQWHPLIVQSPLQIRNPDHAES